MPKFIACHSFCCAMQWFVWPLIAAFVVQSTHCIGGGPASGGVCGLPGEGQSLGDKILFLAKDCPAREAMEQQVAFHMGQAAEAQGTGGMTDKRFWVVADYPLV
jgi:hypothetical protein